MENPLAAMMRYIHAKVLQLLFVVLQTSNVIAGGTANLNGSQVRLKQRILPSNLCTIFFFGLQLGQGKTFHQPTILPGMLGLRRGSKENSKKRCTLFFGCRLIYITGTDLLLCDVLCCASCAVLCCDVLWTQVTAEMSRTIPSTASMKPSLEMARTNKCKDMGQQQG